MSMATAPLQKGHAIFISESLYFIVNVLRIVGAVGKRVCHVCCLVVPEVWCLSLSCGSVSRASRFWAGSVPLVTHPLALNPDAGSLLWVLACEILHDK